MSTTDKTSSSTRVFVSGLPSNYTSKQLREHFAQKFDVTDAHVFPDRRIAFVGLIDHDSAQKASSYFNKSFIRMSKISVELAKPFELRKTGKGQATPVSKRIHNAPEIETGKAQKRKRDIQDDGEHIRGTISSNRDPSSPKIHAEVNTTSASAETIVGDGNAGTGEAIEELHDKKPNESPTAAANDSDWLRGKTSRILDLVDPAESTVQPPQATHEIAQDRHLEETQSPNPLEEATQMEDEADDADVEPPEVPNGRLFLRNLPFSTTEDDLITSFSPFGKIDQLILKPASAALPFTGHAPADYKKIHLVKDKRTTASKGTAYVQFFDPPDAGRALADLDGKPFQGRLLHILPALDKKDTRLTELEISKLPLKKQRALKRKADASSASFGWNSLYMNPDAVLASVALRLGVSKSELLDPSSADAAVKQAQAETSIIQETKDYLRSQGINVEAFKNRSREDRTLLIKNFPFGTTLEELSSMLSEHGKLEKIIFPPSGTMAIARFEEPHSSQSAMKELAYKNLRGSVLYLEKAPSGLFEVSKIEPKKGQAVDDGKPNEDDQPSGEATATVFVRNLNFATTSTRLAEVFKPLSGFLSARVKTRTEASRPGQVLSMGFGFVEFRNKKQADAAVATMNSHRLDGHEILVQPSQKSLDAAEDRRHADASKKSDQQKTKLVIKNLPFEVSKRDIKTLLGGYGTLRSVRIPKKFNNSARGFAFADFITAKEARNAMEALSNTHLLGRRLVIDFAEGSVDDPEEAIKAMEKKAGRQLHLNAVNKMMTGSSRKKFNVDAREDEEPVA